ncbi:MAG TPA: dioxygenase, partial [Pseudonocardia sp.]|nr:dioxygenase [Pseudonocardia sp.]
MEHHEGHGPVTDAERAISAAALGELERIPPGRLRTLLVAAVRHLHTFAMHTRLTDDELRAGLDFLMRAGQESTAERNELVILSDVPGLSAVVDVITHDAPDGATPSALLGPFHRPGAPRREDGAWM